MWRPGAPDLAIVLGAVALAGGLTVLESQGFPELLFSSVLFTVLAAAIRLALRSARLAEAQRKRAAELAAVRPVDAALAAVREERRRLSIEIAASLRVALARIRADAADVSVGPGLETRVRRMHDTTQQATSELRRHLGLLRAPLPDPVLEPPHVSGRPSRADVLLACAMVVLATVESIAYSFTEDWADSSPASVPVTALAAATVLGRNVALGPAMLACAAVFGLGTLAGAPVVDGFWTLGSVGVLFWSVGAVARGVVEVGSAVVLAGAVVVSRMIDTPDNVAIVFLILGVAVLTGLLVRVILAGGDRASRRADAREHELRSAARTAVDAERGAFARELHDVASHAIGVIALQAGAAEVSWRRDPDGARRMLEVILATADSALADLDRLQPGVPGPRTMDDLYSLVDRIRAAGTPVDLTVEGEPRPDSMHVVHRIVQEGLTNVLRHAPGAQAKVSIRADEEGTTIAVVDDGAGAPRQGGRGYGLVGLAERVGFAGGTLDTGPGHGDTGFRLEAVLPAHVESVAP